MLRPIIATYQYPDDPNRLRLDDLTPVYNSTTSPTGYGSPNIARSEVSFVALNLTGPDDHRWSTAPMFWNPSNISLDLLATDFTPYVDLTTSVTADNAGNCGCSDCQPDTDIPCSHQGPFQFSDGLYTLTYEVWGKKGIPADVVSYHLALSLCAGEQVYVSRMGAWINITAEGTLVRGRSWSWSKLVTPVTYEYYEVRELLDHNTYRVTQSGVVKKVITQAETGAMTTSTDPVLVGATTIRFLLTGTVDKRIGKLLLRPYSQLVPCDSFGQPDMICWLSLAGQQLDALKKLKIVDETAPVVLGNVIDTVTYLESVFNNRGHYAFHAA